MWFCFGFELALASWDFGFVALVFVGTTNTAIYIVVQHLSMYTSLELDVMDIVKRKS